MSTALLVDTGFSALPILEALKAAGLEVHVVGARPSDPLVGSADQYHLVDYSDVAAMSQLIASRDFQFLVPGCTDKSYEVCAQVAQPTHRGIDGPEVTKRINDKKLFREVLASIGVPAPQSYRLDQTHDAHGALIVKPVDSFSGRGITVIDEPNEASVAAAVDHAREYSASTEVMIEDFVTGQLYSFSCFLVSGTASTGFFVREDCERTKFAVDTSAVCSDFPTGVAGQIRRSVEQIAALLELADGLFHVQFILNQEQYWILEATRRCPGDLYSILIELATGYEYAKAYVAGFLGEPAPVSPSGAAVRPIMRHTLAGKGSQYLSYWSSDAAVKIVRCYPVASCGSSWIGDRPNRCAVLFVEPDQNGQDHDLYDALRRGTLFEAR